MVVALLRFRSPGLLRLEDDLPDVTPEDRLYATRTMRSWGRDSDELVRLGPVAASAAVRCPETDTGHMAVRLDALFEVGAPPGTRTPNPRIKSPLLCQLS